MFFKKKNKKDNKFLLKGSISKIDKAQQRADILYNHPDNDYCINQKSLYTVWDDFQDNTQYYDEDRVYIEPVIITPAEIHEIEQYKDKPKQQVKKVIVVKPQKTVEKKLDYINTPAKNTVKLAGGIEPNEIVMQAKKSPSKSPSEPDNYKIVNNVKYPEPPQTSQIQSLKKKAQDELYDIEKERWLEHAKNWGGAALEIGSAFVPVGGLGFRLGSGLIKASKPLLGKKIAQEVVSGALSGGISGGVYGLGESMLEDKDPVKTTLSGTAIGLGTGSIIGLGTGKYSLLSDAGSIKKVDLYPTLMADEKTAYSVLQDNFHTNYLEGVYPATEKRALNTLKEPKRPKQITDERIKNIQSLTMTTDGKFHPYDVTKDANGTLKYSPTHHLKIAYTRYGWNTDNYLELPKNSPESAKKFVDIMRKNLALKKKNAAQFYEYPLEEYKNMRLFVSETGTSGFAIKPDGDIVSVFSGESGSVHSMLELAIQNGGTKLDCFDTYLPYIYKRHGFEEVDRIKWDDKYMPQTWDKKYFKDFNNGEPDVVYYQLNLSTK